MGRKSGRGKLQQQQQQQQEPQQQQKGVKDTEDFCLKARNPGQYNQQLPVCPLCEQNHCFSDCPFHHYEEEGWREVLEHPAPRMDEAEPFLSYEVMLDWVMDPEWNWEDLPMVVDLLWARDGEHWERWEQHCYRASFANLAAVVINYLAPNMGLPQQVELQVGGSTPTCTLIGLEGGYLPLPPHKGELHQFPATEGGPHQSPMTEGETDQSLEKEGDYLPLPPPPLEGDYLLLPPPPIEGDYLQLPPSPLVGDYL
ncbi:UNVERIFIED_CONTAM: hypothetical protein FKN15_056727 [Acipenser sinensis]